MAYTRIGKIVAAKGLQGELVLVHSLGRKTDFAGLNAFFIEDSPGNFIPFFHERSAAKNAEESVIKLEGTDTVGQAAKLLKKNVWMKDEDHQRFVDNNSALVLLGYILKDHGLAVGEITEIVEMTHQLLATVIRNGNEALVPIHPDNIIERNITEKYIDIAVPDGLWDVYAPGSSSEE